MIIIQKDRPLVFFLPERSAMREVEHGIRDSSSKIGFMISWASAMLAILGFRSKTCNMQTL